MIALAGRTKRFRSEGLRSETESTPNNTGNHHVLNNNYPPSVGDFSEEVMFVAPPWRAATD